MAGFWWRIIEIASFLSTRIRFPAQNVKGKKRKANEEEKPDEEDLALVVEPHVTPNRGPYPYNQPKRCVELMLTVEPFRQAEPSTLTSIFVYFNRNTIQFTPTQIEAVRAGMQPGLTMVRDLFVTINSVFIYI